MGGIKILRQIQVCQEATHGAGGTPTTLWGGEGELTPNDNYAFPKQQVGSIYPVGRRYMQKSKCEIKLSETEATFEQLGYLLNGVIAKATPSRDGSGPYIYTYDAPTDHVPAAAGTFALVMGDNQEQDSADFAVVTELVLSGAAGEALMMSANLEAHGEVDASFTAALVVPTVEEILFSKGILKIDASGGTIATTPITTSWLGLKLTIPGWMPVYSADGNAGHAFIKHIGFDEKHQVKGVITLENDAFGEAERGFARTGGIRLVDMTWTGNAPAVDGTTYHYKTLKIQACIQYDKTPGLDDKDGNDTLALPFHVVKGAAADVAQIDGLKIILVNDLATLP
jgi:hypothetical protein